MKLVKRVGNFSIEVEGEKPEKLLEKIKETEKLLSRKNPEKPKFLEKGGVEDLAEWIRNQEDPHAKSWIVQNSGFSNASKLLDELSRRNIIAWHETLYETGRGGLRTMTAAFIDGAKPCPGNNVHERSTLLAWLKDNHGYRTKWVEANCGVVRSRARKLITKLLAEGDLYLEPHADGSGEYAVWSI